MKTIVRFFLFCLYPYLVCSHSLHDFDRFQSQFTQEELASRIQRYLQKSDEIRHYYKLTPDALYLYASAADHHNEHPEYILRLRSQPTTRPKAKLTKPLSAYRIAIDPGHLGGSYADLEERKVFIPYHPNLPSQELIKFDEGTLNLMTAKVLRDLLQQSGMTVMLTKEQAGQAVYSQTFETWQSTQPSRSLSPSELFRKFYNSLDLRARAEKINAFQPDLTIIIHYNAHEDVNPDTQTNRMGPYNYNMAFVGGSFCKNELKDEEGRYAFLRLLLTDDLDLSIQLSHQILQQFTTHLKVPLVKAEDPVPYLRTVCLPIEEGLYARNLVLTRCVKGPVCYGETLCQDQEQECLRLNQKDFAYEGLVGPKRVKEVAQAYFEGIISFIQNIK